MKIATLPLSCSEVAVPVMVASDPMISILSSRTHLVLLSDEIDVLGQQTDLAATLLAQLGIDHSEFNFSHDLMSRDHRPFAFYDFPDGFGLITDSCLYVQDNQQDGVPLKWSSDPAGKAQRWGKAYLQHLFDDLDKR